MNTFNARVITGVDEGIRIGTGNFDLNSGKIRFGVDVTVGVVVSDE